MQPVMQVLISMPGNFRHQGIETDFKLTPLLNLGDFDWNVTINYAYNTSEVISIIQGS